MSRVISIRVSCAKRESKLIISYSELKVTNEVASEGILTSIENSS